MNAPSSETFTQDAKEDRLEREFLTPEGVLLHVRIAHPGERIGAALIDFFLVFLAGLLLVVIVSDDGLGYAESSPRTSGALLALFVLRLAYYAGSELYWGGQTPGKRALGLRVVDRSGAALSVRAVVARTLMREVELWLPLTLLLSLGPDNRSALWVNLFASLWVLSLAAITVLNRDVMRPGDMIAGTWVVAEPKHTLLADLAATTHIPAGVWHFSREQLGAYGIHELEVLAVVLRDDSVHAPELVSEVARRIQRKIGWHAGAADDEREFLQVYYRALRRHLESRLLFGKRRLSKYDANI